MNVLKVTNHSIRQINGLYSLNDLHKASGGSSKHQPANFIRLDTTQALIAEIEQCSDVSSAENQQSANLHSAENKRFSDVRSCQSGNYTDAHSSSDVRSLAIKVKNGVGTYACRELVVAYAAWIRPDFHLKVLRVFLAQQQNIDVLAQQMAEKAIAHLQKPRESVNEQVERLAKQLAAPNGYGVHAFLPLWEVMSQKIGQMPWLWADHIRNKDNTFKAQMLTDLLFACNERLWELANLAETHVLVNPKTLK